MTADKLRNAIRAVPFRPFSFKLTGGRIYPVTDPSLIAISASGREVTLYTDKGMTMIDGNHVISLQLLEPS
jgi:hypothetical protein